MAAPQKLIKLEGVVVDSKGGVLPGVTVVVKGTTIGVATDIDGKFSLEITETPGISLEFSFVGMNSKEIPVKIENGKVWKKQRLNWMKLWLPVCFPVKRKDLPVLR